EKRAKAALLSRHVAKEQHIAATPEEIQAEIELIRQTYKDDKETLEKLSHPDVRNALATTIQNRKVLAWLKEQI
ncbi:MAG: hypothetical protein AAB932_05830, partial [Patescibacteria group bacterium]